MSQLRQKFAKRIKEIRQQKGLTQEDLAKASGLSTSFIRAIEQNIHSPSFGSIEQLSNALDVEPKELFNFDSD